MFKCELLIARQTYDVTNDLKNWDDFELLQKRPAYDGVVRSFSTQFEFVKNAYRLLKNEFYTNYLNAEVTVIFSLRNNSWEYDEVFRCALDFSTYSEDGLIVSINAIDNTLAAVIKAKKNIQYEYPVSSLIAKKLKYDGLSMIYGASCTLGAPTDDNGVQNLYLPASYPSSRYFNLPLYVYNPEFPSKGSFLEVGDVPFVEDVKHFAEALSDCKIDIRFDFEFRSSGYDIAVQLLKSSSDGTWTGIETWINQYHLTSKTTKVDKAISIDMSKGEKLRMRIGSITDVSATAYFLKFSMSVGWSQRSPSVNIDVVSPVNLINRLLYSMSGGNMKYKGYFNYEMSDGGRNLKLERAYIMAAESARGLPKAKIYTSYKKFCDWMEAEFGYVPVISGNNVTFTHRDKLFTNTVVKELGKRINDYELTVNDGLVYSSVKVGYDKQDYDSINGRDEFRFTNEFSTGLKLLDNTLSLISPYRADAYGIEFLVQKRGEDTTDNSSDNDVFFVDCVKNPSTGTLDLYRPYSADQLSGLLSPETMFNLDYSPRFMLEANKKYIGACTNLLKFASSDGNSDVSINGVKETDDLPIPERLFTVSEVEVSTSDIKAPSYLTGLVSFNNKGEIITGYIKQLELNIAKEKAATYTLIVKDIKS